MTKKTLAATGFLFPETPLFEEFKRNDSELQELTDRSTGYGREAMELYFENNRVSVSPTATSLYKNYVTNPSNENFAAMVDFMADILSKVDCYEFMEWQAYNRHVTPMTVMFCRDLVIGNYREFVKYSNLTPQSRFLMNESITKEAGIKRHKTIIADQPRNSFSWVDILTPMMSDRGHFATVFRYLFVSDY